MPSGPAPSAKAARDTGVSGPPTRLRIPRIAVDTRLEELELNDAGALRPPSDFQEAGWYADGTTPGEPGPAIIAGHVDSISGPAVFYHLRDLRVGDQAQVQRGGHWLTFTVTETHRYPKNAFPTAAVYGPTPDAQLRLITCGGAFDTSQRSYVDDIVVYAAETS